MSCPGVGVNMVNVVNLFWEIPRTRTYIPMRVPSTMGRMCPPPVVILP